jgi:hypothetical protein
MAMKTARERAEERRLQKLAEVQAQIRSGSLVVRQMTAAERKSNPPQSPRPKRR